MNGRAIEYLHSSVSSIEINRILYGKSVNSFRWSGTIGFCTQTIYWKFHLLVLPFGRFHGVNIRFTTMHRCRNHLFTSQTHISGTSGIGSNCWICGCFFFFLLPTFQCFQIAELKWKLISILCEINMNFSFKSSNNMESVQNRFVLCISIIRFDSKSSCFVYFNQLLWLCSSMNSKWYAINGRTHMKRVGKNRLSSLKSSQSKIKNGSLTYESLLFCNKQQNCQILLLQFLTKIWYKNPTWN